jgi:hypothetical protein
MKEDILEQLVDDYLKASGFFTIHNVKFKPLPTDCEYVASDDCVASDIDVLGFHPKRRGPSRVWVVSCKSWQLGFNPQEKITAIEQNKTVSGRKAWQGFRELTKRKWAEGLMSEVERLTDSTQFTYVTAVTKLRGFAREVQHNHGRFVASCHCGKALLDGLVLEPVLQIPKERLPSDRAIWIEGKPKILGKGAFARSVETGDPDPNFISSVSHTTIHGVEHLLEALTDLVRDLVFLNLLGEKQRIDVVVLNDLFDSPINLLAGVK